MLFSENNDIIEEDNENRESADIVPLDDIKSRLLGAHQRCSAHSLHLVATTDLLRGLQTCESLKLMYDSVMAKCSAMWNPTRYPKQYENLKQLLGAALKRPVVTRWNSLFESLSQLVQLKERILSLPDESKISDPLVLDDFT